MESWIGESIRVFRHPSVSTGGDGFRVYSQVLGPLCIPPLSTCSSRRRQLGQMQSHVRERNRTDRVHLQGMRADLWRRGGGVQLDNVFGGLQHLAVALDCIDVPVALRGNRRVASDVHEKASLTSIIQIVPITSFRFSWLLGLQPWLDTL